jgi:hypothetical protein
VHSCLSGFFFVACSDQGTVETRPSGIDSDQEIVELITVAQPFRSYTLFPDADSVAAGTLNGSNAHQPRVRVSMNSTAFDALLGGRLPEGESFPDGSIIVKEVIMDGRATLLAVLVKDRSNPLAGHGWLWSELQPDGITVYSMRNRGEGCVGCHSRDEGPRHDLIRTFERQHP